MKLVTFVIPIYNEGHILPNLIRELNDLKPTLRVSEFLIIDDGSQDETAQLLKGQTDIPYVILPTNLGKGGAVRAGIGNAVTPFVGIFDGDLEYDPRIIFKLDEWAKNHPEPSYSIFTSRYMNHSMVELLRKHQQSINSLVMNRLLVYIYKILFKTTELSLI